MDVDVHLRRLLGSIFDTVYDLCSTIHSAKYSSGFNSYTPDTKRCFAKPNRAHAMCVFSIDGVSGLFLTISCLFEVPLSVEEEAQQAKYMRVRAEEEERRREEERRIEADRQYYAELQRHWEEEKRQRFVVDDDTYPALGRSVAAAQPAQPAQAAAQAGTGRKNRKQRRGQPLQVDIQFAPRY